jgi:hypothetical protein
MTTFQLLTICLTVLALAFVAAATFMYRVERGRRERATNQAPLIVGHRVTVHTRKPDEDTISGVVAGDYEDQLVLIDAEYVTPGGARPIPRADGGHRIRKESITWIDVYALVAPAGAGPRRLSVAEAA